MKLRVPKEKFEAVFRPTQPVQNLAQDQHKLIRTKNDKFWSFHRDGNLWRVLIASEPKSVSDRFGRTVVKFSAWEPIPQAFTQEQLWAWLRDNGAVIVLPGPASQHEALIAIYKLLYGAAWDRARLVDGWPTCSWNTWNAICDMFCKFDRGMHPNVVPGGLWANNGFSVDREGVLRDWEFGLADLLDDTQPSRFRFRFYAISGQIGRIGAPIREWAGRVNTKTYDWPTTVEEAKAMCQADVSYPIKWLEPRQDPDWPTAFWIESEWQTAPPLERQTCA